MQDRIEKLRNIISQLVTISSEPIVAISGGIDSTTLSAFISKEVNKRLNVAHAISPAVPIEATNRVKS